MKKQDNIFVDNDNDENQSCPPIIQEDITRSINQRAEIRIVKSQEFEPSYSNKSQLQKHQMEFKDQLGKEVDSYNEKKSYSQQKIQVKTIQAKKGTDFNCQKVESVEMSCEQESFQSSSIKSKNKSQKNGQQKQQLRTFKKSKKDKDLYPLKPYLQKKMQEIKQDALNVLIAGSQDMGKTMFIRCFKKRQKKLEQSWIKQRTKNIKYQMGIMDQNLVNRRNYVHFIDLPGFKQEEKDKYLRQIKQQARKQWESYRLKPEEDRRIHCCLYFMRGPRVKQSDMIVMRQLSLWFNLIPVIAKSDQYTKQEIKEIKQELRIRVVQFGVQLFDIQEFYLVKMGTQGLNEFMQSPFGRFPPFVIASSFEKQSPQSNDFARKYPWGNVEIENKEHTDFQILCKILTGDIKTQILSKILDIEAIEEQQRVEVIQGVFGEQNQAGLKEKAGWKTKFVLGSVMVALVFAFLSKKPCDINQ